MDWNIQNANSIHFFGDSLTAGYGTLPQHGWIYQISRRCLPSNTTITVYAMQDLKTFLIPSLRF